jgi:hypothetical protein
MSFDDEEISPEHFRPFPSLVENVIGFCLMRGPFHRHSPKPILLGRRRSSFTNQQNMKITPQAASAGSVSF